MLNLVALGIIAFSIVLAAYGLVREHAGNPLVFRFPFARRPSKPVDVARPGVLIALAGADPATLDGFDPRSEALIVQLPAEEVNDVESGYFETRPGCDGVGQDILFQNRVLVHLPDVPPTRKVELYIEAIPA
ncbi:hypothetical protein CLV78_10829 [Aliiruegeria haliotis]|uniref:Uncharacterized protein n=1 Tax=Aliiruegeria haliotis TaxID=1280846 RepID=A0A2T0RKW2_9RHOB|nr:hypothetical protein [Aliiruegeria haliotis]PRY21760.1 hypothetical protein CLV78_10829 [Aliiruegeria haliotis]